MSESGHEDEAQNVHWASTGCSTDKEWSRLATSPLELVFGMASWVVLSVRRFAIADASLAGDAGTSEGRAGVRVRRSQAVERWPRQVACDHVQQQRARKCVDETGGNLARQGLLSECLSHDRHDSEEEGRNADQNQGRIMAPCRDPVAAEQEVRGASRSAARAVEAEERCGRTWRNERISSRMTKPEQGGDHDVHRELEHGEFSELCL